MKEYTYIMIKPDGVRKGLTEEIVKRIQANGFKIELFLKDHGRKNHGNHNTQLIDGNHLGGFA